MIVVRRVRRSKSFAGFASGGAIDLYWANKVNRDAAATMESARNEKYNRKATRRAERRDAKLGQRNAYNTPETPIRSDPFVEEQYRQYQVNEAKKNAQPPNTKQIWDDVAEDVNKAREKFSQSVNDVKNSVKPDFTDKAKPNPKLLLAGLGVAGVVGAGAYFIRRRKSKNGKQIIERVRR